MRSALGVWARAAARAGAAETLVTAREAQQDQQEEVRRLCHTLAAQRLGVAAAAMRADRNFAKLVMVQWRSFAHGSAREPDDQMVYA